MSGAEKELRTLEKVLFTAMKLSYDDIQHIEKMRSSGTFKGFFGNFFSGGGLLSTAKPRRMTGVMVDDRFRKRRGSVDNSTK